MAPDDTHLCPLCEVPLEILTKKYGRTEYKAFVCFSCGWEA